MAHAPAVRGELLTPTLCSRRTVTQSLSGGDSPRQRVRYRHGQRDRPLGPKCTLGGRPSLRQRLAAEMSNADFGVPLQEFAYEGIADSLSSVYWGPITSPGAISLVPSYAKSCTSGRKIGTAKRCLCAHFDQPARAPHFACALYLHASVFGHRLGTPQTRRRRAHRHSARAAGAGVPSGPKQGKNGCIGLADLGRLGRWGVGGAQS